MRRGKTTGTSRQQSHYLKSFGLHAYSGLQENQVSGPSLWRRVSASLRQKPDQYPEVNLEQLQHAHYLNSIIVSYLYTTSYILDSTVQLQQLVLSLAT